MANTFNEDDDIDVLIDGKYLIKQELMSRLEKMGMVLDNFDHPKKYYVALYNTLIKAFDRRMKIKSILDTDKKKQKSLNKKRHRATPGFRALIPSNSKVITGTTEKKCRYEDETFEKDDVDLGAIAKRTLDFSGYEGKNELVQPNEIETRNIQHTKVRLTLRKPEEITVVESSHTHNWTNPSNIGIAQEEPKLMINYPQSKPEEAMDIEEENTKEKEIRYVPREPPKHDTAGLKDNALIRSSEDSGNEVYIKPREQKSTGSLAPSLQPVHKNKSLPGSSTNIRYIINNMDSIKAAVSRSQSNLNVSKGSSTFNQRRQSNLSKQSVNRLIVNIRFPPISDFTQKEIPKQVPNEPPSLWRYKNALLGGVCAAIGGVSIVGIIEFIYQNLEYIENSISKFPLQKAIAVSLIIGALIVIVLLIKRIFDHRKYNGIANEDYQLLKRLVSNMKNDQEFIGQFQDRFIKDRAQAFNMSEGKYIKNVLPELKSLIEKESKIIEAEVVISEQSHMVWKYKE